jgi:hypothetical protein
MSSMRKPPIESGTLTRELEWSALTEPGHKWTLIIQVIPLVVTSRLFGDMDVTACFSAPVSPVFTR